MEGIQELLFSLKAGYSFCYCQSEELERTIQTIKEGLLDTSYKFAYWDLEKDQDPDKVLRELDQEGQDNLVMVAKNWNWFLFDDYDKTQKTVTAALLNRFSLWTTSEMRRMLVIVGSDSFDKAIPQELRRSFLPITFSLPTREDVKQVYDYIVDSAKVNPKFETPTEDEESGIITAAAGMTKQEIENAFSYSIVKTQGKLDPVVISERKARAIESTSGLKVRKDALELDDLLGYDNIKTLVLGTIDHPQAKGILVLGPPGTGKTTFARAVGAKIDKIVFEMELAEMFGGLVGETEEMVRKACEVVAANAPCILVIDEIEKGLAGVGSGGSTSTQDGGTTQRAMSQLLKFLSDERPRGVYVIATCNDISSLPPEWVRAGRWDTAPFFIDLPTKIERELIWDHYLNKYDMDVTLENVCSLVKDDNWTGAEIEACCKVATMMAITLKDATKYVCAIADTMKEKIDSLRKWAKDRTIPATIKVSVGAKKRSIEI